MTTFSVTTSKNFDDASFSTRAGNDTYNIDGNSRLTIDTDTRYALNSTSSTGNLSTINITNAPHLNNGELYIDGSKVRIIPFSSSAGNVPVVGATITEGGASSAFLGVWSAFNVAPTMPGTAMPGTGYIKVKNVTGSYSVGALTGITASATGPDTVGWIEVVGLGTAVLLLYYKNKFTARGEWFEHSSLVTTGLSGSTYQLPASLDNTYYAGVWVETAVASSVYEFYPTGGPYTGAGLVATDAVRGKVCWVSSQGLVRIGYDGTGTNGYLPVSGCRIRVPNIVTLNADAAAPTVNAVPTYILTNRYNSNTSQGGRIDIDKCNMMWYSAWVQPYSISITNTAILDYLLISECKEPITLTNVGTGPGTSQANIIPFSITRCLHGGTITDCVWAGGGVTPGGGTTYWYNCKNLTVLRQRVFNFGTRVTPNISALAITYLTDSTFTDCIHSAGYFSLSIGVNVIIKNAIYFDNLFGNTNSANSLLYGAFLIGASTDCTVDGISFGGLTRTAPYNLLVYLTYCHGITIKNIGTPTTPLNLGGPQVDDATWTRITTTATVTSVAHGLLTGDSVYVIVSSDTGAITTVLKTPVTKVTDDTFTIVCLNAGGASGTLTYYQVISGYGIHLAAAGGSKDTLIQRCYLQHAKITAFPITVNELDGLRIDNCWADGWSPALTPQVNGTNRGIKAGPTLTNQVATYGTHWLDCFSGELSPNTTAQTWARSGPTLTVTSVGHGLRTGESIVITAMSDPALGIGLTIYRQRTVTVINSSTFTFGAGDAGGTSGTLSYTNTSVIATQMNEPSVETLAQVTTVGTPTFIVGYSTLYTAGDQITWEMPDYCIGHTGFSNCLPVTVGSEVQDRLIFDITYQIDLNNGVGYSAWKNMVYTRTGGATTSGQYTITMTSTVGIGVGDYVHQVGSIYWIGESAKVVSVDSSTQITVDVANLGTTTGINLSFRQFPNEVLDAQKGFKLKFRIYCNTNNTASQFTYIGLVTTSTSTSRAYQYPLSGLVTASTLWNPSIGDVVNLTPSGSAVTYKANIIDSKFPVQDLTTSCNFNNIPGLVIDLDARDLTAGSITSWIDRQNGYVFSGSATCDTAINGRPTVTLTGGTNQLTSSAVISQMGGVTGMTIIQVHKYTPAGISYFMRTGTAGQGTWYFSTDGPNWQQACNGNVGLARTYAGRSAGSYIITTTFDFSLSSLEASGYQLNGSSQSGTNSPNNNNTSTFASDTIIIGGTQTESVSKLLIYNRALTAGEMLYIEQGCSEITGIAMAVPTVTSSLSRYEYLVVYDDGIGDPTASPPWHRAWTTVANYVPVFSALPFVSSSAGSTSSGSITPWTTY